MLEEFNMLHSKPEHVPLPPSTQLLSDMNSPLVDPNLYCRIVGKLIFLMTSWPDLAFVVSTVSHYMSCLQQPHLDVLWHILCYLKKSANYGLLYQTGHHFI
jgi:hypothetical protein